MAWANNLTISISSNLVFSGFCSLLLLLFPSFWAQSLGDVAVYWVVLGGVSLFLFADLLALVLLGKLPHQAMIPWIIFADWAYVFFALIGLAVCYSYLGIAAQLFLLATSIIVAVIASWQHYAFRLSRKY